MREVLQCTCVEQWQEIDTVYESDDAINGFYVKGVFLPCDMFVRYGTPWVGDAPEFRDADNWEVIDICAVSTSATYPYYIELDGEEVRVWELKQTLE